MIWTSCKRKELKRIYEYWNGYGAKIIILATGKEVFEILDKKIEGKIYINKSFAKRLKYASNNITTKYSLLHADDDLTLFSSVRKGFNILQQNDCIDSIYGSTAWANYKNYVTSVSKRDLKMKLKGSQNLLEHLKYYEFSYIYALHRSSKFKKVLSTVGNAYEKLKENQNNSVSIEIGIEICFSLISNMKYLSNVFMIKKYDNEIKLHKINNSNSVEFLKNTKNKKIILDWIESLVTGLVENKLYNKKSTKQNIVNALDLFTLQETKDKNFSIRIKEKMSYYALGLHKIILKHEMTKLRFFIFGIRYYDLAKINRVFDLEME